MGGAQRWALCRGTRSLPRVAELTEREQRLEASDRGAGKQGASWGFGGTRHIAGVADTKGLVTLEGDPLRGGPANPLLQEGWREE